MHMLWPAGLWGMCACVTSPRRLVLGIPVFLALPTEGGFRGCWEAHNRQEWRERDGTWGPEGSPWDQLGAWERRCEGDTAFVFAWVPRRMGLSLADLGKLQRSRAGVNMMVISG